MQHVRKTFEGLVENNHRPHLDLMMASLVNVMRKLATLKDSKFLARIQSTITKYTATRNWLQPAGRGSDISAYMTSGLLQDRTTLNTVNLTLVLSQRALKLYQFNFNVKMMLHKELGIQNLLLNKVRTEIKESTSAGGENKDEDESSVVDGIDEAAINPALSEDSSLSSDSATLDKELAGIQAALQSPQVKETLEKLSQSTKNVLVMKADVQQMDGGMLAIIVKVDTKDDTNQQQKENEESYAFTVRPTN
ncbi:unnamed protein product [Schistocephalus solidus]|uniref:Vacuolar protein sorting-associated protein 53 homolog n=1 Tax=Schistocephalus solidus TaxID=70667 RepID=A0A183TAU3_SCHSO|nr:unnamed protein product [Schistocephalus solidus]